MSRIRNTLLLIIILLAALAGSMKWLMGYYTEKTAKDIQMSLPPGVFNYGGISSPLDGKASIDNIRINLAGEEITIAKIELASKNILDPIHFLIKNWGQSFPSELALNIKGVAINTSSLISNRSILNRGRLSFPLNIPCGKVKALSFIEFVEMGYHQLQFDVSLAYKLVSTNRMRIDLTLNAPSFIQGQLSYYGDLASFMQKPKKVRRGDFEEKDPIQYNIPTFELTINDFPLQRKLYNYCANKENKPLDEFIKNIDPFPKELIDQQTATAFNLVVNQATIDALNNYQKDPKDFYLAIHPTGPTTLKELHQLDESAVLKTLRPKLRINGENVNISFKRISSAQLAKNKNFDPTRAPIINSLERVLVPYQQLNSKAVNKQIEVYTASGIVYKGLFKKVIGDYLYMNIQTHKGFSDSRLERSLIRRVYVLNPN